MMFAYGWAIVRSSRAPYVEFLTAQVPNSVEFLDGIDNIDDEVARADEQLFSRLKAFLADFEIPDLDWHFREHMNNDSGILLFSSSRNHRGMQPSALQLLYWLAEAGPGSYGLVYLRDDEDVGDGGRARGRDGTDHSNEFRVWRLLAGKVKEFDDPFLSPIVPKINPSEYA
jgi:hypothetical protein